MTSVHKRDAYLIFAIIASAFIVKESVQFYNTGNLYETIARMAFCQVAFLVIVGAKATGRLIYLQTLVGCLISGLLLSGAIMYSTKPLSLPVSIAESDKAKISDIQSQISIINSEITSTQKRIASMGNDYPETRKRLRANVESRQADLREWQGKLSEAMSEADKNKTPIQKFNNLSIFINIAFRVTLEVLIWTLLMLRKNIVDDPVIRNSRTTEKLVAQKQPESEPQKFFPPTEYRQISSPVVNESLTTGNKSESTHKIATCKDDLQVGAKKLLAAIENGKTNRQKIQSTLYRGMTCQLDNDITALVAAGKIKINNTNGGKKAYEEYAICRSNRKN